LDIVKHIIENKLTDFSDFVQVMKRLWHLPKSIIINNDENVQPNQQQFLTMTKSSVIKQLIKLVKQTPEIEVLWLYGSRARNTASQNSDYDLAVAFKSYIEDPIEQRIRPELLAMDWQKELNQSELNIALSIIDINRVPLPLAYTVIHDNALLYSVNEYRRMVEEQRIMSKWEIDHLYHRKHYA
jgi:predicted nucleotidyltransferase